MATTTHGAGTRGRSASDTAIGPRPVGWGRGLSSSSGAKAIAGASSGQVVGVTRPLGRRAIDEDPAQRRRAAGLGHQHRAGERARAGAGLDDDERVGRAEVGPPAVDGAGDDGAEQRADLGRGQEVGAPAAGRAPAAGVEAGRLVVERPLDEGREGHRPLPGDAIGQGRVHRAEASP